MTVEEVMLQADDEMNCHKTIVASIISYLNKQNLNFKLTYIDTKCYPYMIFNKYGSKIDIPITKTIIDIEPKLTYTQIMEIDVRLENANSIFLEINFNGIKF